MRGVADLGELGPADGAGLRERVARAVAGGAVRVQAVHRASDAATAWAAARAGLRREGVLRGLPSEPSATGPSAAEPSATGPSATEPSVTGPVRDLAVVAWVAGDPAPEDDVLPALVPLFPTSLLSAGVVLRGGDGRVLLLRTSYKVPWEVPGGVVEDGEGLRASAAREVREELGLDLVPGRLLVLDRRSADGRQPERLLALLDGGVHDDGLPSRCVFADGEILEAAWCGPAQVRQRTGPGLSLRVEAALGRLASGDAAPAVLADGVPEP